jgi:predicted nucleic-acid-binding protein
LTIVLSRYFSKEDKQMNNNMKKISTVFMRKMQSKAMIYHPTPVRMAIIKKIRNNKFWRRHVEKGILEHCWGNVNQYTHYGKQYGVSSKNIKNKATI